MKGVAQGHDLMGQLPVAALARGCELAMHLAPLRLHLALAFARLPALLPWFDASTFVVVVGVVGPPLAVKLAVQAAQRSGIGGHLRAKRLQARLCICHQGDGGRAQIQAHDARAQRVAWLAIRCALAHHLGREAVAQA
jgi:hypothetical protein